jgi:hypothetical protein
MNHRQDPSHASHKAARPAARIAQGAFASVDLCDCGVLLVNIGAVTLRMDASAMSSLVSTLGEAVAEHTARKHRQRLVAYAQASRAGGRGEA